MLLKPFIDDVTRVNKLGTKDKSNLAVHSVSCTTLETLKRGKEGVGVSVVQVHYDGNFM